MAAPTTALPGEQHPPPCAPAHSLPPRAGAGRTGTSKCVGPCARCCFSGKKAPPSEVVPAAAPCQCRCQVYGAGEEAPPSNAVQELWRRFKSFQWMVNPHISLMLLLAIVAAWAALEVLSAIFGLHNPVSHLLFVSYKLPVTTVLEHEPDLAAAVQAGDLSLSSPELTRYGKGVLDLPFVGFYLIAFSFLRQSLMLWVFQPFAEKHAPKDKKKQERIKEQCYAIAYWGTFSVFGLYVMSFQDSWWYQFEHFWLRYPHWLMRPELKVYYLLQGSYWLQQALIMVLQLEAPRKDFYELVAHHFTTLWLIGWSYGTNLTMIGTTVFVAMDIPDTFLGTCKLLNYLDATAWAQGPFFITFVGIWTYFRLYLSALTLHSVYSDFWLIPKQHMVLRPWTGAWLAPFMRWQIFAPLFMLFLLNLFWYALIWRIFFRIAIVGVFEDDREVEEPTPIKPSVSLRGRKSTTTETPKEATTAAS